MKRLLLAVTATLFLTLGLPAVNAVAHTELESSDPAQGAQLTAVPATITLVFGDVISAEAAEVAITVGDQPAQPMTVTVVDDTLTAPIAIDPGPGSGPVPWQVSFSVLSLDGHTVSGVIDFTVTTAEPAITPAVQPTTSTPAATAPASSTAVSPAATTGPASASSPVEPSGTTVSSDASLAGDATPTDSGTGTVLLWVAIAAAAAAIASAVVIARRRRTP